MLPSDKLIPFESYNLSGQNPFRTLPEVADNHVIMSGSRDTKSEGRTLCSAVIVMVQAT